MLQRPIRALVVTDGDAESQRMAALELRIRTAECRKVDRELLSSLPGRSVRGGPPAAHDARYRQPPRAHSDSIEGLLFELVIPDHLGGFEASQVARMGQA
jgi:hypothetical protein